MTATELDLSIPVRECAPWCKHGDGHTDAHPDDRWCWSGGHVVAMRHMRPVLMADGAWWHDRIEVELRREPRDTETLVVIWREEGDELLLSPEEATELRDALTKVLDLA